MRKSSRILLTLLLSFYSAQFSFAQKLDTVYYDKNGEGIPTPAFASYYRVYSPNLIGNKKRYRDYYSNGVVKSEGEYISIDRDNDKQSVFDGECISYFENGKIKEKRNLFNGILHGEYISYYESGLVELHTNFDMGKKDGVDTYFDIESQRCIQKFMRDGYPFYDYCIISDENGYVSKVRLSDKVVIWDSPKISDRKSFWSNDVKWQYYQINGILLAVSCQEVNDYGKWFRITVNVSNHTLVPFDFGCYNFSGTVKKKNGKDVRLNVFDANLFMRKIKSEHNAALIGASISEGLAAAAAGFSRSTTSSNTTYSGRATSYGSASAYGSNGYAYASGYGTTNYSGSSHTVTTTNSYDGFAAYQASVIASNRIASMSDALWQERQQRYEGYLKRTTIRSGETVSGYLNIMREKGQSLRLIVELYGANYEFNWDL